MKRDEQTIGKICSGGQTEAACTARAAKMRSAVLLRTTRRRWLCLALSCLTLVAGRQGRAGEYYIAPGGDDGNPGTLERPLATFGAAQAKVRDDQELGKTPITVYLRGGNYYLPEAIVFTPEDSGTTAAPVVYTAYQDETSVLRGSQRLALSWQPYRDGIMQARTSVDFEIDRLFVDGKLQRMARYPNHDASQKTAPYQGYAEDAFSRERAAHWANPAGGYIHAMHRSRWGGYHYRITGKDAEGNVTYEGGWQNNRQMGMHREFRMVENIFEELDARGEWFHDAKTQTLYYMPEAGVDLARATVEVTRLPHLVEFRGTLEDPVRGITLQGLHLTQTARTFMENKEPLLRSDWTIYRGGAILLTGTTNISILDTAVHHVGSNAIFASGYNKDTLVRGCHIFETGASGVCFVGEPRSVRNPLFNYGERQSYADIDKTPGPQTEDYPRDGVVEDCLIHGIGEVERQPAGVQISMARRITVRDCSIYDCARAGINISEGTFGGHLIERCDVFDTVLETGDHGSFNSWGRDRFWKLNEAPEEALPELAWLDVVETNVIRDSRWRCDHGWGIDLDDGSSNYHLYNNLVLGGGIKLREGFHRRVDNNIAVNDTLSPHVWYPNNHDKVTGNIWMRKYRAVRMVSETWAEGIDRNLFTAEEDRRAYVDNGGDVHSICGDPKFVDPAIGDYRVQEDSPALKIGFQNFPMDQFGVKKPALKAIARVPEFPELILVSIKEESSGEPRPAKWLGATVIALHGDQYSAFGVSQEEGGVHVMEVPADSEAAQAGLKPGDVIQKISGRAVKSFGALRNRTNAGRGRPIEVSLVRGQKKQVLTIEP